MRTKDLWWSSILLFIFILLGNAIGYWNVALFFPGWWTLFIILPYLCFLIKLGLTLSTTIGLNIGLLFLAADLKYYSYELGCQIVLLLIVVILTLYVFNVYRNRLKSC